jgi:predicted CopG family antitoxin
MAVKTITIDLEAYDALARQKKPGQSFSQVIKAHFGPRKTAGSFRRALRETTVSAATLDEAVAIVASRGRSSARVPSL